MAPEQARSEGRIDARTDVFALGCVLYECLTGERAFPGEHLMAVLVKLLIAEVPRVRERNPEVPPPLDALCAWMLANHPDDRPRDGAALAAAIAAARLSTALLRAPLQKPSGELSSGLTHSERRVLSVVLVGPDHPSDGDPRPADRDRDTVIVPTPAELRTDVGTRGGHLEFLTDGSILVTVVGTGVATDQAAQAARCALGLRGQLGDRPMALATGRTEVTGRLPAGDLIDRAVRMLTDRPPALPTRLTGIDEVTAGLLDARFEVVEDDAGLWLHGEQALAAGARTLLGKPTACVGRDTELGALLSFFAECVEEPRARAVLVTAPAGMGKTRLAHEFLRRVRPPGTPVAVWIGRSDPLRAGAAFGLLGQALQGACGLRDGEPLSVRREKLRARVAEQVGEGDAQRVTDFLGELMGTPFPDEDSILLRAARKDAQLMGDQMRNAFLDFLAAATSTEPLILLLEDLHWGDLPTVRFIDEALKKLKDKPWMVLCLARPEVDDLFPKLWADRNVQKLRLSELRPRASARLVRQVLGEGVSAETLERLVAHADGNAFYLEELIRGAAEGDREALPETVLAMVQSRLEGLDGAARRLLRAASIFGEVFWRGGVSALLSDEAGVPQLTEHLQQLEQREWISARPEARFQGEREFVFRHALVREAAYGMLTDEDRALGHRLAGAWLEQASEPRAAVIAEHFDRGGDPVRAVACYQRAAAQALAGSDLEAVLSYTERALSLSLGASGETRGALARLRAEAHGWRRELAEAVRWAHEAMAALPKGSASWYSAVHFAGLSAGQLGQRDRLAAIAEELASRGSEEEATGPAAVATAAIVMTLVYAGLHAEAEVLHDRLEAIAPRFGDDPEVGGYVFWARWERALYSGRIERTRALAQGAIESFERIGNVCATYTSRMFLGISEVELGAHAAAEALLRALLADGQRLGVEYVLGYTQCTLGRVLGRQGALEEARALEVAAIAAFAGQGDRLAEGASSTYLADILRRSGELEEAEAEARRAVSLLDVERMPWQVLARGTLAEVLLAQRRPAEALAEAREAMALIAALGGGSLGEALARLLYAQALEATGDGPGARVAIAEARDRVLAVAAGIDEPQRRASFLQAVPENARILELAQAWLGEAAGGRP
jgi:hypothetical protein